MVADELRRQADQFIDLAELEDQICRDPASRPVRDREAGPRQVERRRHSPAAAASSATLTYPDEEDDNQGGR
jgi:hypothetical protein